MILKNKKSSGVHRKATRVPTWLSFTLISLLVLAGLAWLGLSHGVHIDRLSLPRTRIENLSIRLDQGFIVDIGRLDIGRRSTTLSVTAINSLAAAIKRWSPLVQAIRIKRLNYQDYSGSLSYRNNTVRINSTDLALEATIHYQDQRFFIDLTHLLLKPYQVRLAGKATYTMASDLLNFSGVFTGSGLNGTLRLSLQHDILDAVLRTKPFTDLARLGRQFPLDPDIKIWLTRKIKARKFQIDRLRLRCRIKNGLPEIIPDSIEATARAEDADILFHPDLPPVHCKELGITWQNERLVFRPEDPTYGNKNLAGSSVYIEPVIRAGSILTINLKTNTMLDPTITRILRAYDIDLPLEQQSGSTAANLRLTIDLRNLNVTTKGSFSTGEGAWSWLGSPFLSHKATVLLTDDQVTIKQADLSYQDILRVGLSGTVNTSAGRADLVGDVAQLTIRRGKETLVQAADVTTPVTVDFGGPTTRIDLRRFRTTVVLDGRKKHIVLADLQTIKPFAPILQDLDIEKGAADIVTRDMQRFHFSGSADIPNTLLSLAGRPVTSFVFQGLSTPEETELSINKGKINATITNRIKIHLNDYLVTVAGAGACSTFKLTRPVEITGHNSPLKINGFSIPARNFELKGDCAKATFTVALPKGGIRGVRTPKGMIIDGKNLSAKFANQFLPFIDLKGGVFNVSLRGTFDDYEGYMEFKNVVIDDNEYVLLNNIMAFLDTIPALATFSSPGFNRHGYKVKEGLVLLKCHDRVLNILDFRVNGTSIDSRSHGVIDLKNKTINMDMTLHTLKSFSNIIDNIPWAGYALLGENGTLNTTLKIRGNLEHPDITTNLSEEAVMAPINIIKRAIAWPFKLLQQATE